MTGHSRRRVDLVDLPASPFWMRLAACRGMEHIYFPLVDLDAELHRIKNKNTDTTCKRSWDVLSSYEFRLAKARHTCAGCPVRRQCDDRGAQLDDFGMHAGLLRTERRALNGGKAAPIRRRERTVAIVAKRPEPEADRRHADRRARAAAATDTPQNSTGGFARR